MESYYRRKRQKIKQEVSQYFVLAESTAAFVSRNLFGRKEEPPHPWDYYPKLFVEEQREYEKKQQMTDVARASEARRAYAKEFNRRRQG